MSNTDAAEVLDEGLRDHIAQDIWSHTGNEDDCSKCGAYEPCADCLRVVFRPAADAVLATVRRAMVLSHNGGPIAGGQS